MLGLSTAKVTQAAMNGTSSNQTSAEAAQIAQSDAELLRSVSYQEVAPSSRKAVEGTPFQHEMTVSSESDFNSSVKQKTVTIKVFKGAETNPRSELRLTRYSAEQKASGVPIGTIIAWASLHDPTDGVWLECDGRTCSEYLELCGVLGTSTVPDFRNRFLEGSTTPRIVLEAGLPNITASVSSGLYDGSRVAISSTMANSRQVGAIKYTQFQGWSEKGWSNECMYASQLEFNAAWSNPVYGKSSTVQPPAVTVRWLIKAA